MENYELKRVITSYNKSQEVLRGYKYQKQNW
jgi:hypothetical protein